MSPPASQRLMTVAIIAVAAVAIVFVVAQAFWGK